jgi:HAD superfamily hydrolase (TIGR01509 family)
VKRYILWDHDGVLVETEPHFYEATRGALETLGVDLPLNGYLADMALGRSAWERARRQGIDEAIIQAKRQARDRHYQELLCERDIEIPGVEEVLAKLAVDHSMVIVTTAKKSDFELIHRQRNIVSFMEFVLTRGDYRHSKPAPDPYLTALDRLDAHAAEAVVIEDSERGLRSAIAAGIDCVVVENAFVRGQTFGGARARVPSRAQIPELLASL